MPHVTVAAFVTDGNTGRICDTATHINPGRLSGHWSGRGGRGVWAQWHPRTETSERISRGERAAKGVPRWWAGWFVTRQAVCHSVIAVVVVRERVTKKKRTAYVKSVATVICGSISEGAVITGLER